MTNRLGKKAIVIGGSMAGLVTARALSDYFDHVTILERDHIEDQPSVRKSTPQGNHLHALLLGGQRVLSKFYPGFTDKLIDLGAVRIRAGIEVVYYLADGKAYTLSGTVREARDLGFDNYAQSRGLLEHCVRQMTLTISNIRLLSGVSVNSLVYEAGRVQGVQYSIEGDLQQIDADIVVDASGRGSRAPRWITELGFDSPEETTIGVDFAYASTKFLIPDYYDEPERLMGFFGPPPHYPNGAYMEEIEGGLWHVSLGGRFGDYPPGDESGFLEFARSLPSPKLYELIKDARRVADITQHRFPTSIQRHYERLTRFPEGFLVIGDAICSFNPIYGQGMSSAALQVQALHQLFNDRAANGYSLDGLALEFFPRAAQVIATPWGLAAAFDLAFPKTRGTRPPDMAETSQYFAAVNVLAAEDIEVQRILSEVLYLARPLTDLWAEPLRGRILSGMSAQAIA
jgi:2-polyprenyl-6-methoxyphenol hydroxylase-like FAD-dependent oxidoreductase